jgi:hypothetical protein
VPVVAGGDRVEFVPTTRRYHLPIAIHLWIAGEEHEQRAPLVLDRGGLRRLTSDAAPARS